MNVLLTGASGFVGSHLARLALSEGAEVWAVLRPGGGRARILDILPRLRVIEADLEHLDRHAAALEAARPDLCFHLAWYAEPGEYLHSPRNLDMLAASVGLLRLLPAAGCRRLVAVGTCFEHDLRNGMPLSEDSPVRPATLYATCKDALRRVLLAFAPAHGMSAVWARLFYLYGEFEDARRLVPAVTCALLRSEPARTTPGEQVRDFLHVEDVARALWAAGRSEVTGPVNVGSGAPVRVRDLVEAIARSVGRPDLLQIGALPYAKDDPPVVYARPERLEQVGWRPSVDLTRGIERTVAWWRQRI